MNRQRTDLVTLAVTLTLRILPVAAVCACAHPVAATAQITGHAKVIDGDTVEINLQRIRLYGIDALEHDQTCTDAPSSPTPVRSTWPGGKYATAHLGAVLVNPVTCTVQGRSYNRLVAICTGKDGTDLARAMVLAGYALADTTYSDLYLDDTRRARAVRVGIHTQGRQCSTPWAYRANKR